MSKRIKKVTIFEMDIILQRSLNKESAHITFHSNISDSLDKGSMVTSVLLDLSAAFDAVTQSI